MSRYVFDIEADGLLRAEKPEHTIITKIHCIVARDLDTGAVHRFNDQAEGAYILCVAQGVQMLQDADLLVGHNIVGYDIPAIQKLYPWFQPKGKVRDTQVCAQVIWPTDLIKPRDFALAERKKLPWDMIGKHSLEAWGHRIGEYKSKKVSFERWSQELEDYCAQDVEVTTVLWQRIEAKQYSEFALDIEHEVARIGQEQEANGAPFNEEAAAKLYAELAQVRLDLTRELQSVFKPWLRTAKSGKVTVPKRDNAKRGIYAGCEYQNIKVETVTFNPASRDHIAGRLTALYGWKPKDYTEDGKPKLDEKIIGALKYPEAPLLARYLLVQKRIGQLAEGKEALLKHCKDGRIHGRVLTCGAITRRATHSKPNLAQVPKVKKDKVKGLLLGEAGGWGWEFRSLFYAPPGWKLVGADASGLELRMLGHYMARWDGGAYAKEVIEGDVHSITMNALGITSRDTAKTWKYAWLYGAGDEKLGSITLKRMGAMAKKAGAQARTLFLDKIPALKFLVEAVKRKHREQKYLIGLDKGILHTRSEHAALNTLLQGAGAIVCKLWLVILHAKLRERGYVNGRDYMQILWVHDETQILARPEIADEIGTIAVEAVREAGRRLGLKVPLDGEYKIGSTWAETH